MDLPTHFLFGIAIGFVFFERPEIALLIGLGTLLPDLDREYWFIPRQAYRDEQLHRAALHNVFMMVLTYLVSPFLSLGVFLHALQDSFTTAKDRGVEWFFPLTRLVKHGMYDVDGHPQPLEPKEHVYFYQQDPIGLIDYADIDLREEGPVPWRRVYGPAQNSHILDRAFLFGSLSIILIQLLNPLVPLGIFPFLNELAMNYAVWATGFGSVVILFLAGELDRRDKPLRIPRLNLVKYPLFAMGLTLLASWLMLYQNSMLANLHTIFSQPASLLAGIILIPAISFAVIRWQTSAGKNTVV